MFSFTHPMAKAKAVDEEPEPPEVYGINRRWQRDIEKIMTERGINRTQLADACGVTQAAITAMFKPNARWVHYKPEIHRVLGLVEVENTPAVERDARIDEFIRRWGDLSKEQQELLIGMMAQMLTGH